MTVFARNFIVDLCNCPKPKEISQCTAPRRLLAFAAGFAFLISASANGTAQELTLKAAVFVPPSTTYGVPFKRFVDHVNETGKGVLQIRIVGGPEAVPADGQAQAVKDRRARYRGRFRPPITRA